MKRIFIFIVILTGVYIANAQDGRVFYYHESDEEIYLEKVENTKVVHFKKTVGILQKEQIFNQLRASDYTITEITPFTYSVSSSMIQFDKSSIISTANDNILYVSDMLMYKDSTLQWSSDKIILKIRPMLDLRNLLQESKIPFVSFKQFGFDEQTYLVELNVTENSAIEYANILSESGNVVWAQPSFWKLIRKHNPYYSSQWGFNNTGQYGGISGIDIKVTNAWSISTGTGVKVAVIDEGIDLTHPDLINNLLPGYDATDAVYGGSNGGYGGGSMCVEDAHGTACAGIIAAVDNTIGVKGVAYNTKIIPIRIAYSVTWFYSPPNECWDGWITNDTWIADGIHNAWHDYGAEVLSNSWGGGSPSQAIETEINAALTQGRGSFGSLVIFASGNNNSYVSYPANSNPDIMVVGAMSPCGERKNPSSCDGEEWGSNYGTTLDVIAPGVLIPTTDIQGGAGYNPKLPIHIRNGGNKILNDFADQNYTVWFNGTSAACPHVAGVAALILSANSTLTGQQIRDIIESTTQRVRTDLYTYSTTSGRPNGTWNNQMGYGLVDAYAAVAKAACLPTINFTNQTVTNDRIIANPCGDINMQSVIVTGNNVVLTLEASGNINVQDVQVKNGAKLILDAVGEVNIISDFDVDLGSEFEIIYP